MAQVIIFENETGNVAVCYPTGELPIEQVAAKDVPAGKPFAIVDAASLPEADNDFFEAWVGNYTTGTVTVDMTKARVIHQNRLRALREPKLAALDIAFQRALETGAATTDIVAQKQALRDAPAYPAIAAATTLAELRAAVPTCLQ